MTLSERVAIARGWSPPGSEWANKKARRFNFETQRWATRSFKKCWISPDGLIFENSIGVAYPESLPKGCDYEHDIVACFRDLEPEIPYLRLHKCGDGTWNAYWGDSDKNVVNAATPSAAICEVILKV
jgi:hypothetical protein